MLALALVTGGFVQLFGAQLPGLRAVDANLRDGFVRALASDRPDARLALVDIDEDSLRQLGPWPWPRARLADLAERLLAEHRARLVVFDLVLPEPAAAASGVSGNAAAGKAAAANAADLAGDARLTALAAEGLLVPAQAFDYVRRDPRVTAGWPGGALPGGATFDELPASRATGHVANFRALAGARCVGNVGFMPDFDGQLRRLPLLTEWQGQRYPTLALAALACAQPARLHALADLLAGLPVAADGHWPMRFDRRLDSFRAAPAAGILQETVDAGALAGRIVLVGSSALGLSDRVATPLSASTAGVTVHAAALSHLLDLAEGRARSTPPAWAGPLWVLVSTLMLWAAIACGAGLPATAGVFTVALTVWAALSGWSVHAGAAAPVSAAPWAWAWLLLVHLPIDRAAAQARIKARTRLLSRYVAPSVLEGLLATEGRDPLAPAHAEISVLVADMQDYTRITAYSTLEEAATLTREFLGCLTTPVLEWRGTLDKYTGDGLVAFWGAPLADADHAGHALAAALAIHEAVARYNVVRRARGDLPVRVRIGLATGRALVGDLGTPFRSTYTAVGDVINLASRLQEAAREHEADILASRAMADACGPWRFRPVGAIMVRGLAREELFTPASSTPASDSIAAPDHPRTP